MELSSLNVVNSSICEDQSAALKNNKNAFIIACIHTFNVASSHSNVDEAPLNSGSETCGWNKPSPPSPLSFSNNTSHCNGYPYTKI